MRQKAPKTVVMVCKLASQGSRNGNPARIQRNSLYLEGQVGLHDTSIDEHKEDDFIGTGTSNAIFFMIDKKGKLTIKRHNNMKDKWVSMGSASVKAVKVASGKYYLVTIKDMPYDNTYMPRDADWRAEDAKPIPTNKNYYYAASFNLHCDETIKAVKDNTVLDIVNVHRIIMLYRLFC